MRIDYVSRNIDRAQKAQLAVDAKMIPCTLDLKTVKSSAEPTTLVNRLEFSDRDADRVRETLKQLDLLDG